MSNPEIVKTPTFVESILKVTAREELELDLDSELAKENTSNKTIAQLLQEDNDSQKK